MHALSLAPGRRFWPERGLLLAHAHGTSACPQPVPNQYMSTWQFDLMVSLALALAC